MHKVLRVGKNTHGLKLIGAFIFFIGIFGILASIGSLIQMWNVSNHLDRCYTDLGENYILDCKQAAFNDTGLMLYPNQVYFNSNQIIQLALKPIACLFGWIVVFILGIMIYRFGHHVLPLQKSSEKGKSKKKGL